MLSRLAVIGSFIVPSSCGNARQFFGLTVSQDWKIGMLDYIAQCAPQVSPVLMQALVKQESAFNPYAIGIDSGGEAVRPQPTSLQEAVKKAGEMQAAGKRFSVGIAQIHISNVQAAGLSLEQVFDPCKNLSLGQGILFNFYRTAVKEGYAGIDAVWAALRGYNSGSVHKTISDKYAQDIFNHMQKLVNAPAANVNARTTPASQNPNFAQLVPAIGNQQVNSAQQLNGIAQVNQGAMVPVVAKKSALSADESPDIFQREGDKQGF